MLTSLIKKDRRVHWLGAAVSLLTLAVYLPTLGHGFVIWDDPVYVTERLQIRSLDMAFFKWAFTTLDLGFWHPVTWISYAIDYAIWGLDPRGFHLTAILFHAANTFLVVYLVYLLAARSPGKPGNERAALVAAGVTGFLFGLHPLHVESVAWISERKDVLCALFFLVSLICYVRYAVSNDGVPRVTRGDVRDPFYLASLAAFVLALSSKTMAVSLPVVLLIIDWYPIGRARSLRDVVPLLVEKSPFIALSLLSSVVSISAQRDLGGLSLMGTVPLALRVLVAFKSLTMYLWSMAVPSGLMPLYPYPTDISLLWPRYFLPVVAVCAMTAFCIFRIRKRPVWAALWAYFIITLLPVIGIVPIGYFPRADRFTYLPGLGPFLFVGIAAAWAWERSGQLAQRRALVKGVMLGLALLAGTLLVIGTGRQIGIWRDSIVLWTYVIGKEPRSLPAAYHNRGLAFKELGQWDRAIEDFTVAMENDGGSANTYNSRGLVFKEMRQYDLALKDFDTAISLDPKFADAYTSRGWTFRDLGQAKRAIADYDTAIALGSRRHSDIAYNDRGLAYLDLGRLDLAVADFTQAVALNPFFAEAYTNRGLAFERMNRLDQSLDDYTAAINADPSCANAYTNRGLLLERMGRPGEAVHDLTAAIRLNPSGAEAYNNRGLAFEDLGQFDRAVEDYSRAIELDPGDPLAYSNRAITFAKMGQAEKADGDRRKALSLKRGN